MDVPKPHSVVITGPECTGKTSLAAWLARTFDVPLSTEFARQYASITESLGASDVEPIARGQIDLEDRARADAIERRRPLVVHDTDLVSTVVYARHYYGSCPPWIVDEARARRASLYLLCAPDVPWLADGVRDRPLARYAMLVDFRTVLTDFGCTVVDIVGDWPHREATARAAVASLVLDV